MIEGSSVAYYSHKGAGKDVRGAIRLQRAYCSAGASPTHLEVIDAAGRTWHLQAKSVGERDAWLTALRKAAAAADTPAEAAAPSIARLAVGGNALDPGVGGERAPIMRSKKAVSERAQVKRGSWLTGAHRHGSCGPDALHDDVSALPADCSAPPKTSHEDTGEEQRQSVGRIPGRMSGFAAGEVRAPVSGWLLRAAGLSKAQQKSVKRRWFELDVAHAVLRQHDAPPSSSQRSQRSSREVVRLLGGGGEAWRDKGGDS